MISLKRKEDCCGCSACMSRCPKQCISLHEDHEGFLYPRVDTENCIECGLCEKVCPFINPYVSKTPDHCYAAINNDEHIRMESSSGGIFTLLAEQVIEEGGVVFGARYDDDWQVKLDYTESIEGLAAFRGSKYVQARTEDTYSQCETLLKSGRKVVYSGTPCQIAGLKHFLRKEYDNLLTVDFVCHGVPSPKVWRKYLQEIVDLVNIQGVSMRDKKRDGWKRFNFVIDSHKDDGIVSMASCHKDNDYMRAFLSDMILRPSCYACKAKECRSHSDITIADFWGIQNSLPSMDDDKGTGLVLVHTAKGKEYIPFDKMTYEEVTFDEGCRYNSAIYKSALPRFRRAEFFRKLDKKESVIKLIRKTLRPSLKVRIKMHIRFIDLLAHWSCKKRHLYASWGVNLDSKTHKDNYDNRICEYSVSRTYVIHSIHFRDKKQGWSQYELTIKFKEK